MRETLLMYPAMKGWSARSRRVCAFYSVTHEERAVLSALLHHPCGLRLGIGISRLDTRSIDVDCREMMLAMPVLKAVPGPPSLQDVFHSRSAASAASVYITYVT